MNPWGLIVMGLGLIMIIIGFKGSQHSVIAALKGAKPSTAAPATATPAAPVPGAGTAGPSATNGAPAQSTTPQNVVRNVF
jgi:hypothetical protein